MFIPPLTPDERHVIIDKGTEYPFTGTYRNTTTKWLYRCRQCHTPLYLSQDKFASDCGRPSFDDAIPGRVQMIPDADGMRTEIVCKTCGGHLGHVFVGERMTNANTRHCVNSVSLDFVEEKNISDTIREQIPVYESITVGGGCFWCIEGALSQLEGVIECRSGYMGGKRRFPIYDQVCTWATGHIEVVRVFWDEKKVSLTQLLDAFFLIHDPTSRDRQGNDAGSQYRSVIFFHSEEQKASIDSRIAEKQHEYTDAIITEIKPAQEFWLAEWYHQNFFASNPTKPYCQLVVKPKVEKIRQLQK